MEMEMEMELDFDFGFIGAPSNSIFVSETKMKMELDFQWTGGWMSQRRRIILISNDFDVMALDEGPT